MSGVDVPAQLAALTAAVAALTDRVAALEQRAAALEQRAASNAADIGRAAWAVAHGRPDLLR